MINRRAEQRRKATEAFRRYAAHQQNPNHTEMLGTETWWSDTAVSQTFSVLRTLKKAYIIDAVVAIYFVDPTDDLEKGEINRRVVRFCAKGHMAESTVYGWLSLARAIYLAEVYHKDERGTG